MFTDLQLLVIDALLCHQTAQRAELLTVTAVVGLVDFAKLSFTLVDDFELCKQIKNIFFSIVKKLLKIICQYTNQRARFPRFAWG